MAGYEVGIRVGEFLGRSHYKIFHTTGTAGTLAAAAAVGRLLRLDAEQMRTPSARPGRNRRGCGSFCATRPAAASRRNSHKAGRLGSRRSERVLHLQGESRNRWPMAAAAASVPAVPVV